MSYGMFIIGRYEQNDRNIKIDGYKMWHRFLFLISQLKLHRTNLKPSSTTENRMFKILSHLFLSFKNLYAPMKV